MPKLSLYVFLSLISFLVTLPLGAQTPWAQVPLMYDADKMESHQNGERVEAYGNVFVLFGDTYASADKVVYHKSTKKVEILGNVYIIRTNQMITARRAVFFLGQAEAFYEGLEFVQDPLFLKAQADELFLNVTPSEFAFERALIDQRARLETQLKELRETFQRAMLGKRFMDGETLFEDVLRRYAQGLKRLHRLKRGRVSSSLKGDLPPVLARRRMAVADYAKNYPDALGKAWQKMEFPFYTSFKADWVRQDASGVLHVESASLSPCRCGPGTQALGHSLPPIFSFTGVSSKMTPNEYLFLNGATVSLFTMPMLYVPWLVVPLKNTRQTGLLLPSFYISQRHNAFSQPLFITLGEHADTTLKAEYFSDKGYRFSQDFRFKLYDDSELNLWAQLAEAKKHRQQAQTNPAFTPEGTPQHQSPGDPYLAKPANSNHRWSIGGGWNVPIQSYGALKLNGEWVSDNRYLYDYSLSSNLKSDLFATPPDVKRFLTREAALEFYGDNAVVSLSTTVWQDTLDPHPRAKGFSARLPRLDGFILPRPLWESSPISHHYHLSWERIKRFNYEKDTYQPISNELSLAPANTPGSSHRGLASAWLTSPLLSNAYFTSWVEGGAHILAYGQDADPKEFSRAQRPNQKWVDGSVHVDMPLYGVLPLANGARVRHNFTPSIGLSVVPWVETSSQFPKFFDAFYAADTVVPQKEIYLKVSSEWLLVNKVQDYHEDTSHVRHSVPKDLPLGMEDLLDPQELSLLQEIEKTPANPPDAIQNNELWEKWARLELNKSLEVSQKHGANGGRRLGMSPTSDWRFLWMEASSKYNIESEEEEQALNQRLSPSDSPLAVPPWDKVKVKMGLDVSPWVPVSGEGEGTWAPHWDHMESWGFVLTSHLGGGVSGRYQYKATFEKDLEKNEFFKTTSQGWGVDWAPQQWLRLRYQMNRTVNPLKSLGAERPPREHEYESIQEVAFMKIQDCIDVVLKRHKKPLKYEFEADYLIGVNISMFGQERTIEQLGERLNKGIKDRIRNQH